MLPSCHHQISNDDLNERDSIIFILDSAIPVSRREGGFTSYLFGMFGITDQVGEEERGKEGAVGVEVVTWVGQVEESGKNDGAG